VLQKERSKLFIILCPPNRTDAAALVQAIGDRYRPFFEQESVLRVDSYATVSL